MRDNRCEKRRALQRGHACGGQVEHFSAGKLVSRLICTHCSSHVASVSSTALKATSRLVIVLRTKIRMNRMLGRAVAPHLSIRNRRHWIGSIAKAWLFRRILTFDCAGWVLCSGRSLRLSRPRLWRCETVPLCGIAHLHAGIRIRGGIAGDAPGLAPGPRSDRAAQRLWH